MTACLFLWENFPMGVICSTKFVLTNGRLFVLPLLLLEMLGAGGQEAEMQRSGGEVVKGER